MFLFVCLVQSCVCIMETKFGKKILFASNKEDLRRRRRRESRVDNKDKEEKNETNIGVVTDNLVSV